jgi:hypothetical protein
MKGKIIVLYFQLEKKEIREGLKGSDYLGYAAGNGIMFLK